MTTKARTSEGADLPLFSVPEAAEILGICVRKTRELYLSGALRARRIGTRVLFAPSDLADFVASLRDDDREGEN